MISLNFPEPEFTFKNEAGRTWILDTIRGRYIALTPEEWVRQNVLAYLCKVMGYPSGLISVEKELKFNQMKRRYDIVIYDNNRQPWMLVECKEPDTPINDITLRQLLQYHNVLQCPYWMLSNGKYHFCAAVKGGAVEWLTALPAYNI